MLPKIFQSATFSYFLPGVDYSFLAHNKALAGENHIGNVRFMFSRLHRKKISDFQYFDVLPTFFI